MAMSKILIVEDSPFYRHLLKEALTSRFSSMEISETGDGEQALKKIESFHPDLIFMDIKLPGESGIELTKKIKTQYPAITIIILTAYDIPEYRESAAKAGSSYFISKGASSKEAILKLVQSILAGSKPILSLL